MGDDLPFPGGFCFAAVCIVVPVVAELYFLHREKVIGFQVRVCVNLTGYVSSSIYVGSQPCSQAHLPVRMPSDEILADERFYE